MPRVHLREEILDYGVLITVEVGNASVYYVALERVLQPLVRGLVRIAHICTGPELDVVEDNASVSVAVTVKVFQFLNAAHDDLRTETEADQGDGTSSEKLRFDQEEGEHRPGKASLVLSKYELAVTCCVDIYRVQELLHRCHFFAGCEFAFLEEVV